MSKVIQELRVGESVFLDHIEPGRVEITLLEKSGQRARFSITAKDDVRITYHESQAAQAAKGGLTLVK